MDSYRCIRHPINLHAHAPNVGRIRHLQKGGPMAGTIFLIVGPSGSGKTTLTQELVRRVPGLTKAVTVTTRQPRPGEISGVDYHFVSTKRFREMQQGGELIESDYAYNEHYGVPRAVLDLAGDIAIVITVDGALTLRCQRTNARSIFILPTCPEPRRRGSPMPERGFPDCEIRGLGPGRASFRPRHPQPRFHAKCLSSRENHFCAAAPLRC